MSEDKLLIINRKAPYGSAQAHESLDIALTAAVFEVEPSLLFADAGVLQLVKEQVTDNIAQKNIGSKLSSLSLYDIDQIYICAASLEQYSLTTEQLVIPVKPISSAEIKTLIAMQDTVLTF